jgi:hypothetical protein
MTIESDEFATMQTHFFEVRCAASQPHRASGRNARGKLVAVRSKA